MEGWMTFFADGILVNIAVGNVRDANTLVGGQMEASWTASAYLAFIMSASIGQASKLVI
jgi:hypothetical protein